MTRVLIAEVSGTEGRDLSIEQALLPPDSQIEHLTAAQDETRLIASCRYADTVLVDMAPLASRAIAEMRKCRLVSVAGTGYENVDLQAAQAAGISVCAVGEYSTEEVADHVLLLILALKRRFNSYQNQIRNVAVGNVCGRRTVARLHTWNNRIRQNRTGGCTAGPRLQHAVAGLLILRKREPGAERPLHGVIRTAPSCGWPDGP